MANLPEEYESSWIADLLHSFPHFDLTFRLVNSTFNLEDSRYRESLLLYTALPVVWLLLTLILFLFYFCYRCCQRDVECRKKVSCLQWSMAFIVLLAIGTVGVGFFGNEEAKRGVARMTVAAYSVKDNIGQIQDTIDKLELSINATVISGTKAVNTIFSSHQRLSPVVRQDLIRQTKDTLNFAEDVVKFYRTLDLRQKFHRDHVNSTIAIFKEYAHYRWMGTTACLCWLTLLCLLLLLGIIRTSKCTLLMFCTLGIFSLVLCWVAAGAHLGASVGTGDFCAEPHDIIEEYGAGYVEKDFVRYYTRCTTAMSARLVNPFRDTLQSASDRIQLANNTLNAAVAVAVRHMPRVDLEPSVQRVYSGLNEAAEYIHQLESHTECTEVHKDYTVVLDSFCHASLFGMVLLALSCAATGLLFSILVVMASRAWRNFGVTEREESYPKPLTDAGEDEGPFLPRPGPSAPMYAGGAGRYEAASSPYGRPGPIAEDYVPYARGNAQVHLALQRQANPPPPYSATEFYHQYNDVVNPALYAPGPYGGPPQAMSPYAPQGLRESNA